MYTNNFGKCCDLISIYLNHFNMILENETKEDELEWLEKGELLDEFLPFFYSYDERILMEELLLKDANKILECNNLFLIIESLLDYRQLCQGLIQFYFKDYDGDFVYEDFKSYQKIGRLVTKSDLSAKIQNCLLSFFLDPIVYTQKLVGNMLYISSQISNLYENKFKIIHNIQTTLDADDLNSFLENYMETNINNETPIYYSIGLLQPTTLRVRNYKTCRLVYLGVNYKENISKIEPFKFDAFGRIFAEESRIKILNYLKENGSATISEVNLYMGYSGTTSYYHLSMMLKAGMLKVNSRGKLLRYSINSEYFKELSRELKKYET